MSRIYEDLFLVISTFTSQYKHITKLKLRSEISCQFLKELRGLLSTLEDDAFFCCVTTRNKVVEETEEQELRSEINKITNNNNNNKVRRLLLWSTQQKDHSSLWLLSFSLLFFVAAATMVVLPLLDLALARCSSRKLLHRRCIVADTWWQTGYGRFSPVSPLGWRRYGHWPDQSATTG